MELEVRSVFLAAVLLGVYQSIIGNVATTTFNINMYIVDVSLAEERYYSLFMFSKDSMTQ